jgi:hypothetical protein
MTIIRFLSDHIFYLSNQMALYKVILDVVELTLVSPPPPNQILTLGNEAILLENFSTLVQTRMPSCRFCNVVMVHIT